MFTTMLSILLMKQRSQRRSIEKLDGNFITVLLVMIRCVSILNHRELPDKFLSQPGLVLCFAHSYDDVCQITHLYVEPRLVICFSHLYYDVCQMTDLYVDEAPHPRQKQEKSCSKTQDFYARL